MGTVVCAHAACPDGTGQWVDHAPLATARQEVGAARIGGKVYVVGGLLANLTATPTVEAYDIALDEWSSVAALPAGRDHMAVSIAWGVVFALLCGGWSAGATLAAAVPFGIVVWIAMFHVVLPLLGAAWIVAGFSTARAMTEHVVYGVGVALGLLLLRSR